LATRAVFFVFMMATQKNSPFKIRRSKHITCSMRM
jgi:hypothetical protein